jgi:hypothetical protein
MAIETDSLNINIIHSTVSAEIWPSGNDITAQSARKKTQNNCCQPYTLFLPMLAIARVSSMCKKWLQPVVSGRSHKPTNRPSSNAVKRYVTSKFTAFGRISSRITAKKGSKMKTKKTKSQVLAVLVITVAFTMLGIVTAIETHQVPLSIWTIIGQLIIWLIGHV